MGLYRLFFAAALEGEIEASSDSEATTLASRLARELHEPAESTRWVSCWVDDSAGEPVDRWIEAIDPEVPECDPPTPDLGGASVDELERAWGVDTWTEDGHVWARPHQLLGGLAENPGVQGSGAGVVTEDVCLRCGTVRRVDTNATDPQTGTQGLRSVEYDLGRYASQVEQAWSADEEVVG